MLPSSDTTPLQRLSDLKLSIDEFRALLFGDAHVDGVGHDGSKSGSSASKPDNEKELKRPRSSTACNQCRRLKVRCYRNRDSDARCRRCLEIDAVCEVEKCKRGRVRGSKNKRKSPSQSELSDTEPPTKKATQGVHFQIPQNDGPTFSLGSPDGHIGADLEDPIASGQTLNLPLESARQSPEAEDHHMLDGPHPLSLLSNVGSRLRDAEIRQASRGTSSGQTFDLGKSVSEDMMPNRIVVPGWTHSQLKQAGEQKLLFFQYRPTAIKRDVAPNLDPLTRGLLSEEKAQILVGGFFQWLQPQVGIMDPELHTVSYLRAHSALLLTAVLAASVQTTQQLQDRELARTLYLHADRLFHIALSCDAKSPEIVLALLVLYLWPRFPKRNVDDKSRIFLTLGINMGVELGFPRLAKDVEGDFVQRRQHRDQIRTWTALYIHDRSLSAFSGRPPLIKAHAGADEMRTWLSDTSLSTPGDTMVSGYLELRAIENEVRTRLGQVKQPYLADAVRQSACMQLEAWREEWCSPDYQQRAPAFANMMRFVSMHLALLILSKGVLRSDSETNQTKMKSLAQESLTFLLQHMQAEARFICRTVCAMISWNAVVYLKLAGDEGRDYVRRVGLAMAPYGDGRLDLGAAHFYGSFLLELSFDDDVTPADLNGSSLSNLIPSPSTLWVLQQSVAPAQTLGLRAQTVPYSYPKQVNTSNVPPFVEMSSAIPPESSTNSGVASNEAIFPFELPIWDDINQLTGSLNNDIANFDQLITPSVEIANREDDWQGMASDWPWLFDMGT